VTRLYGIPQSRALRSIWAIEEVGIDYELVPTHFIGDSKKPEYLAINPNGRIPALVDGDVTLFESMAINLYLAKTYGGDLYPKTPQDEARAVQWSFWGMTELEPPLMQMVLNKLMLPENQRSPEAVRAAEQAIDRPLKVLDSTLGQRPYLLGGAFSIADLNVAAVLSMANFVGFDVSGHANVKRWFDACLARPAFARAQSAGSAGSSR
jgi:glutathione S-transferase